MRKLLLVLVLAASVVALPTQPIAAAPYPPVPVACTTPFPSLDTSANTTDLIDIGSGASIDDNIVSGAYLAWVWVNSYTSGRRLYLKDVDSTHGTNFFMNTAAATAGMRFVIVGATASTTLQVDNANFTYYGTGKWLFIAVLFDATATDADQHMIMGDQTHPAVEPTYRAQLFGDGSNGADASVNASIGGIIGTPSLQWPGLISTFQIIKGRVVTIAEAQYLQFHPNPGAANTAAFYCLGADGTGTQTDQSGNGNSGTVTGTSVGASLSLPNPGAFINSGRGGLVQRPRGR